jgi:dienelactone hydrolase
MKNDSLIRTSIRYSDGDTPLTGVLVHDEGIRSERPGILVVHGGAGLDAHAEGRARRLAELGYVVFACDMYGDGVAGNRDRVMSRINELRADRERLCRRAQAGINVLTAHAHFDGRLAAVGYCFGGLTLLELARGRLALAGVVCVHGNLSTSHPAAPGQIKARILVCHGSLDPHSPQRDIAAFIEEMNQAAADWQLIVYGRAMHGFTHETATGQTPGVLYDAVADARSSNAIQRFLEELFGRG